MHKNYTDYLKTCVPGKTITPEHFALLLQSNVDNDKLSNEDFRELVRSTLDIVDIPEPEKETDKCLF